MKIDTTRQLLVLGALAAMSVVVAQRRPMHTMRIDTRKGFQFCKKNPGVLQLVSVEVEGCSRWPCLLLPGRSGTFRITLHNPMNRQIKRLVSDIFGTVKLKGVAGATGPQRVGMPNEVRTKACPFTNGACPIQPYSTFTIQKKVHIPTQARMAHGIMMTEFKVSDGRRQVLTCFMAPVRIG